MYTNKCRDCSLAMCPAHGQTVQWASLLLKQECSHSLARPSCFCLSTAWKSLINSRSPSTPTMSRGHSLWKLVGWSWRFILFSFILTGGLNFFIRYCKHSFGRSCRQLLMEAVQTCLNKWVWFWSFGFPKIALCSFPVQFFLCSLEFERH